MRATVIDGSVRRSGNRIRVTVRLVDVADGAQRWSERYDRELADIFDVQDEIAHAIVDKLKVTLTNGDARLVRAVTANIEAYDLYLRGRALLLKRGRHVDEGVTCLRRAVALDPDLAEGHSTTTHSPPTHPQSWGSACSAPVSTRRRSNAPGAAPNSIMYDRAAWPPRV